MTGPEIDGTPAGPDHDRFQFDDALYVLGSLDTDDRIVYETHLADCPRCQAQVAELSSVPQMLRKADVTAWRPEPLPDTLLPRLMRQVREQRRGRRWRTAAIAAVAACVITLLSVVAVTAIRHSSEPTPYTFAALSTEGAQVQATVKVTKADHGTNLLVRCWDYLGSNPYPTSSPGSAPGMQSEGYRLIVINKAGVQQDRGGWMPGGDIELSTSTSWPEEAISAIQIVDAQGTPLLQVAP
ncbi:zf-HC2 domain-containing protein [Jatrophihabitans sp. DSM 45814]